MTNITAKGERAKDLFVSGYNCAQSVAGAFADEMGLPLEAVLRISMPFGGGMGRLREVCGAFSGIAFVVGQLYGDAEPNSPNKAAVYAIVQELSVKFKSEMGSIICRDIIGSEEGSKTDPHHPSKRTDEYYHKRPCADVCALAASMLEDYVRDRAEASGR